MLLFVVTWTKLRYGQPLIIAVKSSQVKSSPDMGGTATADAMATAAAVAAAAAAARAKSTT